MKTMTLGNRPPPLIGYETSRDDGDKTSPKIQTAQERVVTTATEDKPKAWNTIIEEWIDDFLSVDFQRYSQVFKMATIEDVGSGNTGRRGNPIPEPDVDSDKYPQVPITTSSKQPVSKDVRNFSPRTLFAQMPKGCGDKEKSSCFSCFFALFSK